MVKHSRLGAAGVMAALLVLSGDWLGGPFSAQAFGQVYRLGFSGEEVTGEGVRVVAVSPGTPATRLYKVGGDNTVFWLVRGDMITAVDGRPVRSLDDYYAALRAATPGKVVLTVRDASTGESADWTTDPGGTAIHQHDNPPPSVKPDGDARLYLVIVADTLARNIGDTVKADLDTVDGVFRANVPAQRLHVTTLAGRQVNPGNILNEVGRQRARGLVARRDTLVIYYSGHGAYSMRADDHLLTTSGGTLYLNRDLVGAARQVRPRVTVILSDACSVLVRGWPAAPAYPSPPEKISPIFASLFFDLRPGIVPISASMKGQSAGCDRNGGYFTQGLCGFLMGNTNRRSDWASVLREVNGSVRQNHRDTQQSAYIIGAQNADPAPRFGVTAEATPRSERIGGVEVTWVMSGYPATAMRRPGDDRTFYLIAGRHIITRINGRRVRNYAEYANAVRNSPSKMTVTVYDPVKETERDYEADLGE
jgi:S1-C subfamily serine protease